MTTVFHRVNRRVVVAIITIAALSSMGCGIARAQTQEATPPIQHLDAKTLPHSTVSVPLTTDQQKVLQDKGLIKPGDQTVHELVNRHVMRGRDPSNKLQPRIFTPGAPNLNYGGGQVLQKPVVVPVFWGFKATNGTPSSGRRILTGEWLTFSPS